MINEALRPTRQGSKHLTQISHHFMSSTQKPQTGAEPGQLVLSVLVTGHLSVLENTVLGPMVPALNCQFEALQPPATFRFRVLEHPQPGNICQDDPLLLIVDASLPGIRETYRQIKALSQTVKPAVGVIIRGSRDPFEARRYYRRLATGCLRFLNQPIANLGWVPDDAPATEEQIHNIVNRIRKDHFYQAVPEDTGA